MADQTFSDIFTPVESDYGLISLRKVLGCTVDAIWKGGSCGDANMVATAAGFFNVVVAIVAAVLVTYTLYTAVSDTASEGESMGGNSTKYTVARIGLGAIMLLPVAGGFTLAQLLVIQLLVWGSGAGDNLWAKISPMMASGGHAQVAQMPEDDYILRGQLSAALQTRAQGFVCAARLNQIAGMFQQGSPVQPNVKVVPLLRTRTMGFADKDGWYNKSDDLCGTVMYRLPAATAYGAGGLDGLGRSPLINREAPVIDRMTDIATSAFNAGAASAWSMIDTSASQIAQAVLNNSRDDQKIQDMIKDGVNKAQKALRDGVMGKLSQNDEAASLAKEYIDLTTKSGWVFAISWQRANVNISSFYQNAIGGISFEVRQPEPLAEIISPMTKSGFFSGPKIVDPAWKTIADLYERDSGYIKTFEPYFASFANVSANEGAGEVGNPDNSSWGVSELFKKILKQLKVEGDDGPTKWSDPLLVLTNIGSTMATTGAGLLGASAVADSYAAPVGWGKLVQSAASAGWFAGAILLGAGFWIGGILPLLPLLYFFGAVISWLVVGLEALIAVPVWVLSHFFPSREPSLIGASRQGYLLLFGVLIRPVLIIMGLVVAMLLMYAAFGILNSMFFSVFALMIPLDATPITSALISIGAIVMYLSAATVVVSNSSAMISELGDAVLRWIEVGVQSLWSARFGSDATSSINPAGGLANIGRQVGQGSLGGARTGTTGGFSGLRRVWSSARNQLNKPYTGGGGGGGGGNRRGDG